MGMNRIIRSLKTGKQRRSVIQVICNGLIIPFLILLFASQAAVAVDDLSVIGEEKESGSFALVAQGKAAPLVASNADYPGVIRILKILQGDIQSVSRVEPSIHTEKVPDSEQVVLIGTLGKSPLIDQLVQKKKLDVSEIQGKWDAFLLQTIKKPMKGGSF